LRLFYQIQVDQQHRPLGAEALVRWLHPRRGMVPPAQFIGIAEESRQIIEIGNWVIDTACPQLACGKAARGEYPICVAALASLPSWRTAGPEDSGCQQWALCRI